MCAVSFVGDSYRKYFDDQYPKGPIWPYGVTGAAPYSPSKAEFDELKAKVEEMLAMLKAAKAFDIAKGQPDCQMDEKLTLLRKLAAVVGLDLDEVLATSSGAPI